MGRSACGPTAGRTQAATAPVSTDHSSAPAFEPRQPAFSSVTAYNAMC